MQFRAPETRIHRLTLALGLTLALPGLVALPSSASAAVSEAPAATVRVVVIADELGETSDVYAEEIAKRLRAAIEQAGYTLDDSVRADVTVRMRISFYNADDLDYQIQTDISAGAEIVRLEPLGCPQCVDEALVETIAGQHPQILAALERAGTPNGEGPQPETGQDEPPTERPSDTRPLGALGGAGIGVAVLGLGAIVAGGVELGRGRVYDNPSQTPTERTFVDHRPAGAALLGVGGVLFTAGVTMLIVDVVARSKQRRRAPQTSLVQPMLGPGALGLSYSAQF